MAITAAMVKELREKTGAGMMDCKKALTESNGDMDKAVDLLKKQTASLLKVWFILTSMATAASVFSSKSTAKRTSSLRPIISKHSAKILPCRSLLQNRHTSNVKKFRLTFWNMKKTSFASRL